MVDYIPHYDADFNLWQAFLVEKIDLNLIIWGISDKDFVALKSFQALWAIAFERVGNKQNHIGADMQAITEARNDYEVHLRIFVSKWLTFNCMLPVCERERMGLNILHSRVDTDVSYISNKIRI